MSSKFTAHVRVVKLPWLHKPPNEKLLRSAVRPSFPGKTHIRTHGTYIKLLLMFHWELPVEDAVVQTTERRRLAEAARHQRIFDTRQRVMGLDTRALESQVAERRERAEEERRRDRAHDVLRVCLDGKALDQQREEEEKRRALARDIVQYRALYQRAQDPLDADVNYSRQGARRDNASAPVSLGPASMQVFQGEGIGEEERRQAQMELTERALRTQKEERERREKEHKLAELLKDTKLVEQCQRGVRLDYLEEKCKRAACIALKNYNQAQADERLQRERQEQVRQEGEKLAEVWHMVTSDLLTECPNTAEREGTRSAGAPRVLQDRWKGMNPEQLSAIYTQREQQLAERETLRELERQREMAWCSLQLEQSRQQLEEDRRTRELEKRKRAELDRYNQQLAKEQQIHQQFLNNELYTNRPTARYFKQFSRSSR